MRNSTWLNTRDDLLTPSHSKRDKAIRDSRIKRTMVSEHQTHCNNLLTEIERIIDSYGSFRMSFVNSELGTGQSVRGDIVHDLRNICIFSTKAQTVLRSRCAHIMDADVEALINSEYSNNPENYLSVIRDHFMLARGGTMTGQINNQIGRYFTGMVVDEIITQIQGQGYEVILERNETAASGSIIKEIKWTKPHRRPELRKKCMVVFDRNLTWVASERDKNYDVIFVESHDTNSIQNPDLVRCVVELKGGSDSAGADEHYTTAEGKLRRIQEVQPTIPIGVIVCMVDGTVAESMWNGLERNFITYAANGEIESQVRSFISSVLDLF